MGENPDDWSEIEIGVGSGAAWRSKDGVGMSGQEQQRVSGLSVDGGAEVLALGESYCEERNPNNMQHVGRGGSGWATERGGDDECCQDI